MILRGSGPTTAALARLAAENGVATLAHAEGGGVLYLHESASPEKALALAEASLDRLGVCNRLNLALVDREAPNALLPALLDLFRAKGLEVRGDVEGALPLDGPLGYDWASDPERVSTVTVARGRRARRGGADRERGDVGARRRDRHRGRGGRRSGSSTATAARPRSGTRRPASRTASS